MKPLLQISKNSYLREDNSDIFQKSEKSSTSPENNTIWLKIYQFIYYPVAITHKLYFLKCFLHWGNSMINMFSNRNLAPALSVLTVDPLLKNANLIKYQAKVYVKNLKLYFRAKIIKQYNAKPFSNPRDQRL